MLPFEGARHHLSAAKLSLQSGVHIWKLVHYIAYVCLNGCTLNSKAIKSSILNLFFLHSLLGPLKNVDLSLENKATAPLNYIFLLIFSLMCKSAIDDLLTSSREEK